MKNLREEGEAASMACAVSSEQTILVRYLDALVKFINGGAVASWQPKAEGTCKLLTMIWAIAYLTSPHYWTSVAMV
jgi:hypothetical protein